MGRVKIEISRNFVVFENDIVNRPPFLGVREWLELWEGFQEVNEGMSPKKVTQTYLGRNG